MRGVTASFGTIALLLSMPGPSVAQDRGWFPPEMLISNSADNCWSEEPLELGVHSLFICQTQANTDLVVAGAEFGLQGTSVELLELIPAPGFQNLGTTESPILVTEDCPGDFVTVLAELRVLVTNAAMGGVCFVASDQNGINCSIVCDTETDYVYHLTGSYRWGGHSCPPVSPNDICMEPLPVDNGSWGRVKSAYRNRGR